MLIDLSTAKAQISAEDGDPDGNLPIYIGAAEGFAAEYLQRNIYETQEALTAAIASAPAAFAAAVSAYEAAVILWDAMDAGEVKAMTILAANEAISAARKVSRMTHQGIVLNDSIRSAMLLIIGHLSLNREENSPGAQIYELPMGARSFLDLERSY